MSVSNNSINRILITVFALLYYPGQIDLSTPGGGGALLMLIFFSLVHGVISKKFDFKTHSLKLGKHAIHIYLFTYYLCMSQCKIR